MEWKIRVMDVTSYGNSFRNRKAFKAFKAEAVKLELRISRNLSCKSLYLYVDEETGHIIFWYKDDDPKANILDRHYSHLFNKIIWNVRSDPRVKSSKIKKNNSVWG